MPLADALARFRIDRAFGAADAATIREVVSDAYRGSPTARAMLDRLPEEGRTLRVWFETGEFGAGDDAIFIDLAWLRGNAYLAPSGTAVADTPTTAIVHELVHAIEGLLDYPSFPEDRFTTDTAGPTVTRANAIYGELGLPRQLSYDGYASEGELVVGRNYTGGQRVEPRPVRPRLPGHVAPGRRLARAGDRVGGARRHPDRWRRRRAARRGAATTSSTAAGARTGSKAAGGSTSCGCAGSTAAASTCCGGGTRSWRSTAPTARAT